MNNIGNMKGSLRTLLRISFPLMISYFSLFAMLFVDRGFLAQLSTEAHNAAVQSGTLAWAIQLGWLTLGAMAEIFVAQNNGARRFDKLGIPVWQMLWVALFSTLMFFPTAIWGSSLIYGAGSLSGTYFSTLLYFGPIYVVLSSISAFYIGQGKTLPITILAVVGNLINVVLDPIFIFGIDGVVPAMGIKGAALATGIGVAFQVLVLSIMFLSKKNREEKGTKKWKLSPPDFISCLKVGISPAILICLELVGWSVFYQMMGMISPQHIFVAGVCQSILMLFIFFGCGIEKGIAAIAGNFIGAGNIKQIYKLLFSGFKLTCCFALLMGFFLVIYPDLLVNWFIKGDLAAKGNALQAIKTQAAEILQAKVLIKTGLVLIFFYLIIENIRWMISGVLTAAGDTFFLMISGTLSVWVAMVLPTYFFVVRPSGSITTAFFIWLAYATLITSLYFIRFLSGKWKTITIIEKSEQSST